MALKVLERIPATPHPMDAAPVPGTLESGAVSNLRDKFADRLLAALLAIATYWYLKPTQWAGASID